MPIPVKGTDLIYFPAPKIACTSIKRSLLAHNEPDLAAIFPSQGPDGKLRRVKVGGKMLQNVHEYYLSPKFRIRFYHGHRSKRWVCFVRDPISRFLSAYGNRILFHNDVGNQNAAAAKAAGLPAQPDLETFIDRFDEYRTISSSARHHTAPIWHFLGPVPQRYARIFTLKEMPAFETLCAEAGAPLCVAHRQASGPKFRAEDLSARHRRKLERFYALDYRLYGRHFE